MIAHPEYQRLQRRFCACRDLGKRWRGHVYRCSKLKHTNKTDLLSGKGSFKNGGRWNFPGLFPVIYTSLTPQTALQESLGQTRHYGIPEQHRKFPRSIVAMKLKLNDVLDLTDGTIRKHLFVSRDRMIDVDWERTQIAGCEALPQAVGRAAYKVGLEGLLVPAKADSSGANLIIFSKNLQGTSRITFENEEELPD